MYLLLSLTAIIHSVKCTVPFSLVVPLLSRAICHLLPFVVTRCHSFYYSLSLCHLLHHSLSLVFILCHSLSFIVPLVVIRCHSLSFVVTRCITRLSFYNRSTKVLDSVTLKRHNFFQN